MTIENTKQGWAEVERKAREFEAGKVSWAGQLCEVLQETPDKLRIRFTNATGTCEMWIGRGANLYRVPIHP